MVNSSLAGAYSDMTIEERLIYTYLVERVAASPKIGCTQQEISRHSGLSLDRVRGTLTALKDKEFLDVRPSGKRYNIFLLEPYHEKSKIPFTYDDTDDKRIKVLEQEVLRLSMGNKESRKLSSLLQGERAAVVGEIERHVGGLTPVECYLVGQAMALVGPERLKNAWRQKAHEMKDPVRGVTAMLLNRAYGKTFTAREDKPEVTYRKFRREDA